MAASLSRALKLPGKKGSELGEYDPLTQADSEDDSEEDDLVLNYPRNGLGRGSCLGPGPTEHRRGRSGRLVDEEELEEDEEEEEDEWRDRPRGKKRQDREDIKHWSQREVGRDGTGAGVAGEALGPNGGAGLGLGPGADPDGKRARVRNVIRTTAFLVPLGCAMVLVLLCAFLLPCPQGALHRRPEWERELGDVGGVNSPPLALWDVDNDAIEDLLIGVTQMSNESQLSSSLGNHKEYSVVALSALSGEVLWRKALGNPVLYVQCGLQSGAPARPGTRLRAEAQDPSLPPGHRGRGPVCLLVTLTHLTAVNASTGKQLWEVSSGQVESPAVPLPDLQGDSTPVLLIATLADDKVSDLSLRLLSGTNGALIGQPVTFNLTEQGKLIGPMLHETTVGAYYIVFGLGAVEAVSLRDIYTKATSKTTVPAKLRLKDPSWERLKKTNSSTLIHISSGKEEIEYMLPLVAGMCNNHNNLDAVSALNVSRSDWVVMTRDSRKLSVLRERDTHTRWTLNASAMHSRPCGGYFNDDSVPDLVIQLSSAGVRKVQMIDGASGQCLWEAEFQCPLLVLEGSAVMTTTGQSAFLFWAGEPLSATRNVTKATVNSTSSAEPVLRRLFLLHPAYPTILLQLTSTTDTVLTSAVSYDEQDKDASYLTVSSRPTSGLGPEARVVRSLSLRASIAGAQTVRLGEESKPGAGPLRPSAFEINKFFRHLSFKRQQQEKAGRF
ncbi:protein FAM234B [Chanos chanos]|uniref:Protein FAM234B n=1 Tax=Chanos chanos TaxID=29144 RepID=A0A6J2WXV7_CHACN|nr:protein FAM234B [Chanos chanos]